MFVSSGRMVRLHPEASRRIYNRRFRVDTLQMLDSPSSFTSDGAYPYSMWSPLPLTSPVVLIVARTPIGFFISEFVMQSSPVPRMSVRVSVHTTHMNWVKRYKT